MAVEAADANAAAAVFGLTDRGPGAAGEVGSARPGGGGRAFGSAGLGLDGGAGGRPRPRPPRPRPAICDGVAAGGSDMSTDSRVGTLLLAAGDRELRTM
jgi:hypothetical protein